MSFDFSSLKWGRIVLGAIVGFVIAFLINIVVPTVIGFQVRGNPPQDMVVAAVKSPAFQIGAALLVLLGGLVGGRMAAHPAETNRPLAGLVTGVLLGVLLAAWRAFSWGTVDLWVVIFIILAILGGWLGGQLAARRTDEEFDESPQL